MATRFDIKRQVRLLLGETWGSDGHDEPVWLNELVSQATDNLCMETDCYYTSESASLTGSVGTPQASVTAPSLRKIMGAVLTYSDTTSKKTFSFEDDFKTAQWMDMYLPTWRSDPSSGEPLYLIIARPLVYMYPRADYTLASALTFYGYGKPAAWASETSTFPLPDHAIPAVVYEAAYLRCIQFPSKENGARLPLLDRERARHRFNLEANVGMERDRSRIGTIPI